MNDPRTRQSVHFPLFATLALVTATGCPFVVPPPAGPDEHKSSDASNGSSEDRTSGSPGSTDTEPPTSDTDPGVTSNPATTSPSADDATDPSATAGTTTPDDTTVGAPPSACELFGGMSAITTFVDTFDDILYADDRINVYFLNQGFVPPKFSMCLANYLAVALECDGAAYTCDDMQTVHAGMRISAADVADFHEDFVAALDVFAPGGLPEEATAALLAAVDSVGAAIVEDPGNDGSVYQRLDRNPALLAFAADLNGQIMADPVLGNFSGGMDDPDKLARCYARYVGDAETIQGPMLYGKELAPLPECADSIGDVHSGVKDIDDAAITLEDFEVYIIAVAEQVALSFPDASQEDSEAIIQVFAEQCEAVVSPANECPSAHEVLNIPTVCPNPIGCFVSPYDPMEDPPIAECHKFTVESSEYAFVGEIWIDDFKLDHTWGGDLVITLTNPEGDVLLHLLKRPGYPTVPTGYGPIFSGDWPVSFRDSGDTNGQDLGKYYDPGDVVCKTYGDCLIFPPPNIMETDMTLSAFEGVQAAGNWELCIEDHTVDGNTGYFYGATLHIDKVKYSL